MKHFNVIITTENQAGSKHKPLIKFFDAQYAGLPGFAVCGQFTGAEYLLETLLDDREILSQRGLSLDGGIPAWTVSPEQMKRIFRLIDAWMLNRRDHY